MAKPKRPKKPKASATLKAWIRFDEKMRAYQRRIHGIGAAHKKKASLVKKYSSY